MAEAQSALLYTDEGWYSGAAMHRFQTGHWLTEGDYNPAVLMPVCDIIKFTVFKTFGFGIVSARLTTLFFFFLLALCLFFIIKKFYSSMVALASVLYLMTNFYTFSWSRLATLDIPMAAISALSLLIAISFSNAPALAITIFSAIVFVFSVLTKTTAIFTIPAILYVISTRQKYLNNRVTHGLIFCLIVGMLLLAYYSWAQSTFPADFRFVKDLVQTSRLELQPLLILKRFARSLLKPFVVDWLVYPTLLIISALFFILRKEFRNDRAVRVSFVWILSCALCLASSPYSPPRYYTLFIVPILLLFSKIFSLAFQERRKRRDHFIFATVFIVVLGIGTIRIVAYITAPKYSYIEMATGIKKHLDDSLIQPPVVLGDLAPSLGLVIAPITPISIIGSKPLSWKIDQLNPTYFISLGESADEIRMLSHYYLIEKLASYDVFDNYAGNRVFFYRLTRKN